jgi:excinuclease ABC subunit A
VVEHALDVIRCADWIVDVGPAAGEKGGEVLYSGPPEGSKIEESQTRRYLFDDSAARRARRARPPAGCAWKASPATTCKLEAEFPLGVLTAVTGVSGSGKSSLVSQVLVDLVARELGQGAPQEEEKKTTGWNRKPRCRWKGRIAGGMESIKRMVRVDQKPIGRTPRSNLATYTGLFDQVRKLFAATRMAKKRATTPGAFPSTSPRAAASTAPAKASSWSSCCSCPASTRHARPARARATTPRRWKCLPGQEHRRGAGMTVDAAPNSSRTRRGRALAGGAARSRPGLPAAGPAGHRTVGRRGPAHQAGDRIAARRPRQHLYVLDEPTTGLHPSTSTAWWSS